MLLASACLPVSPCALYCGVQIEQHGTLPQLSSTSNPLADDLISCCLRTHSCPISDAEGFLGHIFFRQHDEKFAGLIAKDMGGVLKDITFTPAQAAAKALARRLVLTAGAPHMDTDRKARVSRTTPMTQLRWRCDTPTEAGLDCVHLSRSCQHNHFTVKLPH